MKKWTICVVVFYILALLSQAPCFYFAVEGADPTLNGWVASVVLLLPSMIVVVGGAALLLTLRVKKVMHYPMCQRHIVIPIAVGVLLFLLLAFTIGVSSLAAIWQEEMFEEHRLGYMVLVVLLVWCVWALVFYRYFRARGYEKGIRWLFNVLLAGSVLELLIAVTSHMIMRHRGHCSAPILNFWGLLMGLSIMFIAFGPGIIFLYKDKMVRAEKASPAQQK